MDLLDCNKTTVRRNLKKYKEFGLEALLQETRGGRHREYMTYEEEQAFLKTSYRKYTGWGICNCQSVIRSLSKRDWSHFHT